MIPIKIFNDPVHGFIEVPKGILLDLINHPYVQRLRRIKQLALSSYVYPGAEHTRFSHAMGALHLTQLALNVLKNKNINITPDEYISTLIAILLHDIGHGPFSHALEHVLIPGLNHETLSLELMKRLNSEFKGELSLAIQIFQNQYTKKFLHQLVSGQLDMDRMDYLMRDSFFTGVVEGIVGTERIIKTLYVVDNQLVVEEKGIYSVEKFIIARRLMYWQVYLHKTAVTAETMLVNILKRVRYLYAQNEIQWIDENLKYFLSMTNFNEIDDETIARFVSLEDVNILYALQQWRYEKDKVLSDLCSRLLSRKLFKLQMQSEPFSEKIVRNKKSFFQQKYQLTEQDVPYYVYTGELSNQAYFHSDQNEILISYKNGTLKNLPEASDISHLQALAENVVKYYLVTPEYN